MNDPRESAARESAACHLHASAVIELYFYGELAGADRDDVERHLGGCAECRLALEELTIIRTALKTLPDVSAPAGGDWSAFMVRLQTAVNAVTTPERTAGPRRVVAFGAFRPRTRLAVALAMAAVVALVTMSVLVVVRDRTISPASVERVASGSAPAESRPPVVADPAALDPALVQASSQHFERSKLVVLGLTTKDPAGSTAADWDYERRLATSLLNDTRLYRQAAETRGMKSLADVLRDLELVLLQTSMSEQPDADSLARLQRLIRRRDLLTKMDVVTTTAGG
jgi:hypothetical protein